MARADYYILAEADQDSREHFLCRLCDKILSLGMKVYIHTGSDVEAKRLDQQLWAFKPEAFIPHTLLGAKEQAPIEIGFSDQRPNHQQVFVNLARHLPEDAFAFERIVEVIIQDPEVLVATRENYQKCRDQGLEVHHQDMRKKAVRA